MIYTMIPIFIINLINCSASLERNKGENRSSFKSDLFKRGVQITSNQYFIIKYIKGHGFLAFTKKGKYLFKIYAFDNGPDYISEGLFRIIEDNKIGYANEKGRVVIPPMFDMAKPFEDGIASVCMGCKYRKSGEYKMIYGGKWGFINKEGKIIVPILYDRIIKEFDKKGLAIVEKGGVRIMIDKTGKEIMMEKSYYDREWIKLLEEAMSLLVDIKYKDQLIIKAEWVKDYKGLSFKHVSLKFSVMDIESNIKNPQEFITYLIIPWQSIVMPDTEINIINYNLMGVNEFAIIYEYYPERILDSEELSLFHRFSNDVLRTLNIQGNSKENKSTQQGKVEDSPPSLLHYDLPEELQIITLKKYPWYLELEVACEGSNLAGVNWGSIAKDKMLLAHLVPSSGPIHSSWYSPETDLFVEYEITEKLIDIFRKSLKRAQEYPDNRRAIFINNSKDISRLMEEYQASVEVKQQDINYSVFNTYKNKDLYITRLTTWLLL